jgi:predicted branched-subunit amino acid permease
MLIIAFVVVVIPAFRSEETPAVRTASILTVLVFVVYIGLKLGGVGHPDFPVMWVLAHLEPLRRMLENMSKQPH